jgi:hypothetical protein
MAMTYLHFIGNNKNKNMSLTKAEIKALEKFKNAKLELELCRKRLISVLPDHIASEIHYNGRHANIPQEYNEISEQLRSRG